MLTAPSERRALMTRSGKLRACVEGDISSCAVLNQFDRRAIREAGLEGLKEKISESILVNAVIVDVD